MVLEDYFDFLAEDDIRIKGHRIGIETVLAEYIYRAQTPEEIVFAYPSLTLDQIYATILYYLRNKEAVDKYLDGWLEFGRQAREDIDRHPSEYILRLRELKNQRQSAGGGARATG